MGNAARRRVYIAVYACLILATIAGAQDESERAQALATSTFVPTSDPALRRRLDDGLRLLREGDGKGALERLLPEMKPDAPAPVLPWGARETRQLFELLEDHLSAAPPAVREAFVASLEPEAVKALQLAGNEPRWLAGLLRAFPGTAAAATARLRLVDVALEAGDWALAGRHLGRLPAAERAARAPLLARLREMALRGSPWPVAAGLPDGLPGLGPAPRPGEPAPERLADWPRPPAARLLPFLGPFLHGVVGRAGNGRVAVFQDPLQLYVVAETPGGKPVTSQVSLTELTRLPPSSAPLPCRPCFLGDTLLLVHGGQPFDPQRDEEPLPGGAELLALSFTGSEPAFRVRWRWSPAQAARSDPLAGELDARATLQPAVVAVGHRCYVLLTQPEDRLNTRLFAACFDLDGHLEWLRLVCKGAPLTADLLQNRQEQLRTATLRPAPPVLAEGALVVGTGLGVVAALDPLNGETLLTLRYARLRALKTRETAWEEGGLAAAGDQALFAPTDGSWFYRLSLRPGLGEALLAEPEHKRSMVRFLGCVPSANACYFLRQGLRESGPMRLLLAAEPGRPARYDAPPFQPHERLLSAPLLTTTSLIVGTTQSLYWLDLVKDLFYERACELAPLGLEAAGPAVPFGERMLVFTPRGPLLW